MEQSLIHVLRALRAEAVNKRIDLTDAFSEYAGTGRDAAVGVMPKHRFVTSMGTIFKQIKLETDVLLRIVQAYGAGDPDPGEPGTLTLVRWKQFAIDFDEIEPAPVEAPGVVDEKLLAMLRELRAAAANKRLDMTDAFSEYAGTGRDANLGIMSKQHFKSAMGTLYRGIPLSNVLLDGICAAYGCGDADLKLGGLKQVRWKQFAIDFDEISPPPPPPMPDPTPEIVEAMREMNVYTDRNGIDLANDIEEYLGGKDKCSSDLMGREMFKRALGALLGRATSLYRHEEKTLDAICHTYRAGRPDARHPGQYEQVQWREFARDVHGLQPQPYLQGLQGGVIAYPQRGALPPNEGYAQ